MAAADTGSFRIPQPLPLPVRREETDERGNGFGTCLSCRKFKRVWCHICSFCGEACE